MWRQSWPDTRWQYFEESVELSVQYRVSLGVHLRYHVPRRHSFEMCGVSFKLVKLTRTSVLGLVDLWYTAVISQ